MIYVFFHIQNISCFLFSLYCHYRYLPPSTIHTYSASSILNIPHQSGTFVTMNGPVLKLHYHPESTVYIRAHSDVIMLYCL